VDNPFCSETTAVVERLAYTAGLRVFTTALSGDSQLGQKMLKDLILRQVDGILVASGSWIEQNFIHSVVSMHLPMVYCFWEEKQPASSLHIAIDLEQGGRLAGKHLLALGHQRFGVITHRNPDGTDAHRPRVAGFQNALLQNQIHLAPSQIEAGQSSMEGGKAAAYKLLAQSDPPTAIFATDDAMAIGAMSAAWELGLQIPGDLSIVGLDNITLAQYMLPALTTVAIDQVTVLSHALRVLLAAIDGRSVVSPPPCPVTLVVRSSTGPCPQQDSQQARMRAG
jgi:DNA-binding LacI/PurR family transcriptional regulator